MSKLIHAEITYQIIGAAFEVWKVLGYGFLEKVYENALIEELKRIGLAVQQQFGIDVYYKGIMVGQYVADLFVEGKVIVEIKAEKEYIPRHEAQLLNYLKATGVRVGLLLNFGEKTCLPVGRSVNTSVWWYEEVVEGMKQKKLDPTQWGQVRKFPVSFRVVLWLISKLQYDEEIRLHRTYR